MAVINNKTTESITDARNETWDIEVVSSTKTATLTCRKSPLVNYTLNDISHIISFFGKGTTGLYTHIFRDNNVNELWIRGSSNINDGGLRFIDFIKRQPEISFVTQWTAFGQTIKVPAPSKLFKRGVVVPNTGNSLIYTNNWGTANDTRSLSGVAKWTTVKDALVWGAFPCTRVAIYGSKVPDGGKFNVYINNAFRATIDQKSSTRIDNVVLFDSGNLPRVPGNNKVEVFHAGGGGAINISQIEYVPLP